MTNAVVWNKQQNAAGKILRISWHVFLPALALLSLTGCSWLNKPFSDPYVVPTYPTAEEQARSAWQQYARSQRTVDEETRREELEKSVASLKKVLERFPNNRVYTPPAHELLGRVYLEMGQPRKARSIFEEVVQEYPEVEDVHAAALYGLAESSGRLGRRREEKQYYQQLIDAYAETEDPTIQRLVSVSRQRYSKVETE